MLKARWQVVRYDDDDNDDDEIKQIYILLSHSVLLTFIATVKPVNFEEFGFRSVRNQILARVH